MKAITAKGWALLRNGQPVHEGEELVDFRGDPVVITGGTPPHKEDSTGRVYTQEPGSEADVAAEYYPNVVDCIWVKLEQVAEALSPT